MSENPLKWRLRRFISSRIMRRLVSPSRIKKSRLRAESARTYSNRPHEVHYFHQLDDPYSHLASLVLPALSARYNIHILPHLVGKPPAIATPEADMLEAYSRHDASRIAPFYGLSFENSDKQPSSGIQNLAARVLTENHLSNIADISAAVWAEDEKKLEPLPKASLEKAQAAIAEGTALRAKLKHYLGAMFYYEGEWYWGIDRLPHLEERLDKIGARKPDGAPGAAVQRKTSAPEHIDGAPMMRLEYFPSFRSPYAYISMAETLDLPRHYPVELVLRPVMPMVMRGMKVSPVKGFYIFSDTKREADRKGVEFGRFLDPVGPPVLRGYSLFSFAQKKGLGGEYLHSFLKAAFAEGIDVYARRGLRKVVERAGLNWREALEHLDNEDWHDRLEQNRLAMFEAGCWGVPSYRLTGPDGQPDLAVWGNDRLWLIKEEITRRASSV